MRGKRNVSGFYVLQRLTDGTDMFLVGTTTASSDIQQPVLRHLTQMTGRIARQFIVFTHFVGQSGIGI